MASAAFARISRSGLIAVLLMLAISQAVLSETSNSGAVVPLLMTENGPQPPFAGRLVVAERDAQGELNVVGCIDHFGRMAYVESDACWDFHHMICKPPTLARSSSWKGATLLNLDRIGR